MMNEKHPGMQSLAVAAGVFVPMPATTFRDAYRMFVMTLAAVLPPDPEILSEMRNVRAECGGLLLKPPR